MTWLDNPIANMYGPHFLGLYLGVIAATLALAWWLTRYRDPTAGMPAALPAEPDPYEAAYLRGDVSEVCRLAVLELLQRGFIRLEHDLFQRAPDAPDESHLPEPARRVLGWFQDQNLYSFEDLFTAGGPENTLDAYCRYELRPSLERRNLLADDTVRLFRVRVFGLAALVVLGFGGYKLQVALWKGYTNVAFLVVLAVSGLIGLLVLHKKLRPMTSLGRRYLGRLRFAFDAFRERATWDSTVETDPRMLLTIGVFGAAALAGPVFAGFGSGLTAFEESIKKSASSSGAGCGGGCGGGGCGGGGCGGGCGGCGG